ncbi:MAG TPA: UPF0182 family protein [Verrucomicrobiae bacterium]|jgi:uncharacterized membrane protein (UPF0182 family)|nr:UPF0182 family protein [Verrucomicrobiae bacterium]
MRPSQIRNLVGMAVLLLIAIRVVTTAANFIIEYNWWREVGQASTWISMLWYSIAPATAGAVVAFIALWVAHARGLHFTGVRRRDFRFYSRAIAVGLALVAIIFASASIDNWTVMRFFGSRGVTLAAGAWKDPLFSRTLPFYLFDLPFYSELLGFVFVLAILSALVFWATARGWQLAERLRLDRLSGKSTLDLGPQTLLLPGAGRSGFVRAIAVILLVGLAAWVFLGNYELLFNSHAFMTGADYVDEKVTLPLRWFLIVAALAALPLVWTLRYMKAFVLVMGFFILQLVLPGIVSAVYVRPNEISIERPYIERHIQATTDAFGLNRRSTERPFAVSGQEKVDAVQDATLLDNIRLWDLRAYKATITQIQALRPYYTFPDTDVDRYIINDRIKQVLLSPREIDVNQLSAEASQSWINPRFIYTHGFGVVVSEVNKITPDGLPSLLIENAPPEVKSPGFRLTRPEIYYGESTQDPVFVHTAREEFDYPSGDQNKYSTYGGSGGFPVRSLLQRTAAAISQGEPNVIFTGYLTGQSRMMIYRNVKERLAHLAGFLHWDPDPYLVISDDGKLVWMVDGYTTSLSHPYSATLPVTGLEEEANYIRNAVKATVDAYTGEISLYVFDPSDPIIEAFETLFPKLFRPASEMPADLRRHARYPEVLFRTQAEAYRIFHMRDPQVFYNKEDIWEIAHSLSNQSGQPTPMQPTYVVATLPGEKEPEFLLILPFTPRGKDNLIGWMAARCDGDQLGKLVYFQLSKQQLVYGPMQIESRIDQDQNISKDLSLWNQQGSRVLRGNVIALPVTHGFLYVESIYIQANEARMPQVKKVVLAMGDRLIYRDTFDEALAELTGTPVLAAAAAPAVKSTPAAPEAVTAKDLPALAERLSHLREQAERLARDLDTLEKETRKK